MGATVSVTPTSANDLTAAALPRTEFDRAAICCITVEAADGKVLSRGTGTLIYRHPVHADGSPPHADQHGAALGIVLSALHVVANRRAEPPTPYPGVIKLTFPSFTTTGTIVSGAWDRVSDWVLIECAAWPPIQPMQVARLAESARAWQSYGFPDANPYGMLLTGTVAYCDGTLESVPAHQLSCEQAAAGGGGKVSGMSGAPVVIGGQLVGVMRFALMDAGRTEMGTLYACPVGAVSSKWPMLDAPPLPPLPRQLSPLEALTEMAGRELFAITAASMVMALVVLLLATVHVPSMNVEGSVQTSALGFTLGATGPLGLESGNGLLEVSHVTATGLDSVRIAGDGQTVRAANVEMRRAGNPRAHDALVLDFGQPLDAGTQVRLLRAPGRTVNRYELQLRALRTPVTLAFGGRVSGTVDDGENPVRTFVDDTASSPVEQTLQLFGAHEVSLLFDLPAGVPRDEAGSDGNLSVQRLDFTEVHDRGRVRTPAIRSGTLLVDGRETGSTVRLHMRDSLIIGADSLRVFGLSIPGENGMIAVTFGGTARALDIGSADGTRLALRPTWLTRVRQRYPIQAFVVGLAFALFVASMAIRRMRRVASARGA